MILGVTGSRQRNSEENYVLFINKIYYLLKEKKIEYIVTGGCETGADNFALLIAKKLGIPIKIYFPKLPPYGSQRYEFINAYYKRNKQIAEEVTHLIAMPIDKINWSGGTGNTINFFIKKKGEERLILL